ncbi:AzlD domain-containing protein [Sporolactobacillus shoreicorticis]|uniref:AzlD domain-containing protein n=1 Tax=Sporolactobacillus shoreicorticis TaxID=1923877 RepID=A0ABW5S328_9BACL|nr:AzlD domain-containing protein [Sporolactobacillus shoreicorticis]MCO7128294.1 AzlD domain-containing protein [Sporolactobacillus shoreicorticis]
MLNQWILIGTLAVATYLSRIVGIAFMAHRNMNPTLRLYFNYVPIAIITALLVKQVFIPTGGRLMLSSPVLISCFVAAISISLTKRFLPSVVLGVIIGLVCRHLIF